MNNPKREKPTLEDFALVDDFIDENIPYSEASHDPELMAVRRAWGKILLYYGNE
jgi:hypothetical protein